MRFVLVHGGFHGAWCWTRTIDALEVLGHEAVAIDVPGHGERANEEPTQESRRQSVLDVLQPGDVLVGHSGGGFEVTWAADAEPDLVRHVVYLAAALPLEGRPMHEALIYHDDDDDETDCDESTAGWAFGHLTPERMSESADDPVSVPTFWAAPPSRSFIRCGQDRCQPQWLADVTVRRLGVEPLTIDSSRSPFLSRPAELAQLLVTATTTEPVGPLKPG